MLDDNGRELILESAFRVACADGVIEEEEDLQLRQIADALSISEGVLELEIGRFQRQLALQGPPGSARNSGGPAADGGSAASKNTAD